MLSLPVLFLGTTLLATQVDCGLENSNLVTWNEDKEIVDFNRFRANISGQPEKLTEASFNIILDNKTYYNSKSGSLDNRDDIYRASLEYSGEKHLFVAGLQRVPFGVGRIWNPIDLFNPINSLAIETGERKGTEAIRYEYAINELSNLDMTISRQKNAIRLKGYLDFADMALVAVSDQENEQDIIGWEIEGEMFGTGIDLRSEGGNFRNRKTGQHNTAFIGGLEYGFPNSLTLLGEYYFDDETKSEFIGCTMSYQPAPLWFISLLTIINLNEHSSVLAPSLQYSLSDESTVNAGGYIYQNDNIGMSEQADTIYLRWFIHF